MLRVIIKILIPALIGALIAFGFDERSRENSLYLANLNIPREIPKIDAGTIVLFGGNRLQVAPRPVGRELRGSVVMLNVGLTIDVARDGRMLLNGEIKNANQKVAAMLIDSKLFISPGVGLDVNWDKDALEIVDETKQPILQAIKSQERLHTHLLTNRNGKAETRQVLRVNLVSYGASKGDPLVTICDDSPCTTKVLNEVQRKRMKKIARLFKYPGYANPGVRARAGDR